MFSLIILPTITITDCIVRVGHVALHSHPVRFAKRTVERFAAISHAIRYL